MTVDGSHVVAIVTAVAAAASGWIVARVNTKPSETTAETAQHATLVSGYTAFATKLQEELDRVRKSCQEQIDGIRREHAAERDVWHRERDELRERVEELEAQVVALLSLPPREPGSRTRRNDP